MKAFWAVAAVGLALIGPMSSAQAQSYGGYDRRDRDDGYRDRGYGERGGGYRRYGFDEREYLRCNPDVRRAVRNGQMESGAAHFRVFGRREGRRLSC
jgi:hypothetical protein